MQEVANIRIDERLIHGQVAIMWTNLLNANRIMIIDDETVKNDIQKALLKVACPVGVKLSILSIETASNNLKNESYKGDRIFIIAKNPTTLLKLRESGFEFDSITVGNMSTKEGSKQLKKSVSVTERDIESFRKLKEYGVNSSAQTIPNDEPLDIIKLIEDM